jgi:hypothetical protein
MRKTLSEKKINFFLHTIFELFLVSISRNNSSPIIGIIPLIKEEKNTYFEGLVIRKEEVLYRLTP